MVLRAKCETLEVSVYSSTVATVICEGRYSFKRFRNFTLKKSRGFS